LLQDLCQEGVDAEDVLQVFDLERGEIEVQELEEREVEAFG
jgi:SOS response regulatory protein OraA/RecX